MNSLGIEVKIESLSQVKKKLFFDIPWKDVKKEMDDVYKNVGKSAKIKGFRNGKVPRKILESFYKEQVETETITNIVNKYFWDALKDHSIDAVTQPEIDQPGIEENKTFSFAATVETEPNIDPQGYVGLKIEKVEFEITDTDIDARLNEVRKMFATLEDITEDRGVHRGDTVVIDFQGSINDMQLEDVKAENYTLEIGSESFVPGFEDQLTGMKKDESKQFDVTFPKDYHAKHMAGEKVTFDIVLKSIKGKKLPEIDDNFIKNFERYDSLTSLKDDIRKTLEEESKMRGLSSFKNRLMDKLLEQNPFEAPPSFVEKQIYYMMADMQRRMMSSGMANNDATELSLKMHDQLKDEAEKIIKSMLLLKNIAKKESISVSREEVDNRILEIARRNQKDFQTLKYSLEKDDSLESLEHDILNEKIFKYLEEKADISSIKKPFHDEKEDK